jgi:hypothetical protein
MNAAGDLYPCYFHYCVAHVIELTTGIAFTDEHLPGGNSAIKDAHSLVGHFSGSTQATELLLNAQRPFVTHPNRPLRVIKDVETRWWSTFSM